MRELLKNRSTKPLHTLFTVSLLSIASATANAQLTQNLTIGNPKALALGNAVTADPPSIDSIHFNPAGLAKIKGKRQQFKFLTAVIEYETKFSEQKVPQEVRDSYREIANKEYPLDPIAGSTSSTSKPALILPFVGLKTLPLIGAPFAGIAIEEENYGWTFATAIYSPQAIGYERGADDPGAFQGQKLSITRLTYFSPSVAFNFSENLMFGASIGLSWQGFGVISKFRAPESTIAFLKNTSDQLVTSAGNPALITIGPYDTVGTLEMELEDPVTFSFNVGLLWEPTEWLSVGAVFQSESKSEMQGDFKMEYTDEWNAMIGSIAGNPLLNGLLRTLNDGTRLNNTPVESGSVTMEQIHPAHFALGTSVKVLPDLKVNIDAKWTDFTAWNSLDFNFSSPVDFLSFSNVIYKFSPSLGDGDNADPTVMRIKRDYSSEWNFSIGAEYQYNDRLVLRAGYEPRTSVVPKDRVDLLAPIADADLYSFGVGYQWDTETLIEAAFGYLDSGFDAPAGTSENTNTSKSGRVVYNPYSFLDLKADTNAYIFALSYDRKF